MKCADTLLHYIVILLRIVEHSCLMNLATARVFETLELFGKERRPMSVSQISRALAAPKSSMFNVLQDLVELGLLDFDPIRRFYFPTLRVATMGSWVEQALFNGAPYEELLLDLATTTGETTGLSVQRGYKVQFIRVVRGENNEELPLPENATSSVFTTSAGRVLLSLRDDHDICTIVDAANAKQGMNASIDTRALLRAVRQIRAAGFALTAATARSDTCGIAVNLRIGPTVRPVALSIVGARERVERKKEWLLSRIRDRLDHYFPPHRAQNATTR